MLLPALLSRKEKRPPSKLGLPCAAEWAQDIPLEAFGPRQEAVLTAPSATHLYCMRLLQSDGDLKTAAEVSPQ